MATKRRPIHQMPTSGTSKLNFRPSFSETKGDSKGTKPTIPPASIKEIFTLMILHVCKKSLLYDTNMKIAFYLGALFLVSLIADFSPLPKNYLASSSNLFNQYFVKFAWGWNLTLVVPYVALTTYVYCCGKRDKMLKSHLARIAIATFFWYFWTSFFNWIETNYGRCIGKSVPSGIIKQNCLKLGFFWNGFDISGHSFILIYGSLMLIEEGRSIVNWDSIKEMTRQEVHMRQNREKSIESPLNKLSDQEVFNLEKNFDKYTPYIRALFIVITLFQLLWDVMLICTILYHHRMVEKFLGGSIAILTWFFTYRVWYEMPKLLPGLPGEGSFKYNKVKTQPQIPLATKKRQSSLVNGAQVPKFMGMPLYQNRPSEAADFSAPSSSSQVMPEDVSPPR